MIALVRVMNRLKSVSVILRWKMNNRVSYSIEDIHKFLRNAGGYSRGAMKVLAELNACRVSDIYAQFPHEDWGEMKEAPFDEEEAEYLYRQGLSDREIARQMTSTRWKVKHWRMREGYPAYMQHQGGRNL
jgi:hypothetical protein